MSKLTFDVEVHRLVPKLLVPNLDCPDSIICVTKRIPEVDVLPEVAKTYERIGYRKGFTTFRMQVFISDYKKTDNEPVHTIYLTTRLRENFYANNRIAQTYSNRLNFDPSDRSELSSIHGTSSFYLQISSCPTILNVILSITIFWDITTFTAGDIFFPAS